MSARVTRQLNPRLTGRPSESNNPHSLPRGLLSVCSRGAQTVSSWGRGAISAHNVLLEYTEAVPRMPWLKSASRRTLCYEKERSRIWWETVKRRRNVPVWGTSWSLLERDPSWRRPLPEAQTPRWGRGGLRSGDDIWPLHSSVALPPIGAAQKVFAGQICPCGEWVWGSGIKQQTLLCQKAWLSHDAREKLAVFNLTNQPIGLRLENGKISVIWTLSGEHKNRFAYA